MEGRGAADGRQPGSSSIGADFAAFRSACPLKKFAQPHSQLEWSYYQAGPASDANPLVFLHGTSSTAAAFFYQVMSFSEKGYSVVSAQYPAYGGPDEWCKGFDLFLDGLRYRTVHLVGAGLGGFLAQHYACKHRSRVRSLVLCNSFASTNAFALRAGTWGSLISIMPTAFLRQAMQDTLPQAGFMEIRCKQAVDWVGQQLNDLSGEDLASRLNLNVNGSHVGPLQLESHEITILESSGDTMVPEELRRQLKLLYRGASFAELKSRGDFPYLSRPDEVTLFVEVHMRRFGAFAQGPSVAQVDDVATDKGADILRDPGEAWVDAAKPQRQEWKNPFEDDDLLDRKSVV